MCIRDSGLIAQHPDKKAVFTTNAEKYLKKLKTLDKEYTEAFSLAKQKSFVTQHSAFAYLALDYGLTQVPILSLIHIWGKDNEKEFTIIFMCCPRGSYFSTNGSWQQSCTGR